MIPIDATAEPLQVFVSIAPQKAFVQQIGKDCYANLRAAAPTFQAALR